MMGPTSLAIAVLSLAAAQHPTFRTGTELVRVDVLVTHDGVPVTGLTADDFEVRDEGRRQEISAFGTVESVDAVVTLDSSGSMVGDRLPKARAAALALLAELRPDESGTVMAFASQVIRLVEPHTALDAGQHEMERLVPGGATALVDAAYASVISVDTAPGPKLLVLLTDGRNNTSWLQGRDVIDAARRHEVVVYGVSVGRTPSPLYFHDSRRAPRMPFLGHTLDPGITAHQSLDDASRLLRELGRETGGRLINVEWTDDLSAVFRGILAEFRQRYILSFRPEAVGHGNGWHALDVRLRRGAKGDVYARSGYWSR